MNFEELENILNSHYTECKNVQLISAYSVVDYYVVQIKFTTSGNSCFYSWGTITHDGIFHIRGTIGPDYYTLISGQEKIEEEIPIKPLQVWRGDVSKNEYIIIKKFYDSITIMSLKEKTTAEINSREFKNYYTYLGDATRISTNKDHNLIHIK